MLVSSVLIISRLDSQSKFQMLTQFSGRHIGVPRYGCVFLLDSVYFYRRNISKHVWSLGKRTGLKHGEVSHLDIFLNITISQRKRSNDVCMEARLTCSCFHFSLSCAPMHVGRQRWLRAGNLLWCDETMSCRVRKRFTFSLFLTIFICIVWRMFIFFSLGYGVQGSVLFLGENWARWWRWCGVIFSSYLKQQVKR